MSAPTMYRLVFTTGWTLRLFHGNDTVAQAEDTPENVALLRRKAEEDAGHELDWAGGHVRTLQDFRSQRVLWQAPDVDVYDAA